MEVKKNQDYIVTIEDLSVEGEGIGKISEGELGNENGFPLFVKDTVEKDLREMSGDTERLRDVIAVSYTHLTLPTPSRV